MRTLFLLLLVVNGLLLSSTLTARAPMTIESIQRQLLAQPWSIMDRESVDQRDARSKTMARSLFDAAKTIDAKMSKRWLVGATIAIWWQETRFSLEVHRGGLSRWGSDDGKAKCFGQLHQMSVGLERQENELLTDFRRRQIEHWESLAGTDYDATKRCAEATMRQLLAKLGNCAHLEDWEHRWLGAFGDYGSGGRNCIPGPTSEKRLNRMKRVVSRL